MPRDDLTRELQAHNQRIAQRELRKRMRKQRWCWQVMSKATQWERDPDEPVKRGPVPKKK